MSEYVDFLKTKRVANVYHGKDIATSAVHPLLFPFQRDVVRWAVGVKTGGCVLRHRAGENLYPARMGAADE